MKKYLYIFIWAISGFISVNAQSFHYDTVPDPRNKPAQEKLLYQIEQPETQQSTVESKQVSPPASTRSSGFNKNNLEFGGTLGASFSSGYTALNISPQIGYAFNRFVSAGVGVGYNYYRYSYSLYDETRNYLGFNVYGRVRPIRYLAFQVQPEIYNMWGSYAGNSIDSRTVTTLLVGGGGIIPAGNRGGVSLMIYYDVLQNDWSPYGNDLIYSIGYVVNF